MISKSKQITTGGKDETFIEVLQMILNAQDLHINNSISQQAEINTMGLSRAVVGMGFPRTVEQVQLIVKAAARFAVALYPVSQGKNIGYGEMTPTGNDQFVLNLKYLNQIREFDNKNGEVLVEPGVTQGQLAEYLKQNKSRFWADVTGASPDASIIGNTLEAGFGHTPIGDHRKHVLQMEIVLPNGQLLTTAEMPSIGPDLAQLFIQSNFGIVTAIRIPLFPIPEETFTFAIAFESDEKFFNGIEVLTQLRQQGIVNSLVHTGNATRVLMTSSRFPNNRDAAQVLTEKDCLDVLKENSLIPVGAWSMVGGIYGFKTEVRDRARRLKKALKGIAQVKVFSDQKIEMIHWLLEKTMIRRIDKFNFLRKSFQSLRALHGILRGQPSSVPSENIYWRVDQPEKLGLMWHAPVIPATAEDADALLNLCRFVYAKYRFEMPVTLTLINHKKMTAVFNIAFDKSNDEEKSRAHAAYNELSQLTSWKGYLPYRCGILSDAQSNYSEEQNEFLQTIKAALDPMNIVSPGRYGIGKSVSN